MTHVTCRLTAKNQNQLRNHTLGSQVWANFTFFTWQILKCSLLADNWFVTATSHTASHKLVKIFKNVASDRCTKTICEILGAPSVFVLQFVCDIVKGTGKEIPVCCIGLDCIWNG